MLVKFLEVVKANKSEIALFVGAVNQAVLVKQPMSLRIATVVVSAGSIYCGKVDQPSKYVVGAVIGGCVVQQVFSAVNVVKNKQVLRSTGVSLFNIGLILATRSK